MSDIIQRLNALTHLTPDQIASKLAPKRWYKFGDLTLEEFAFLNRKLGTLFDRSALHATNWSFWGNDSASDRNYFRTTLADYHFILTEDYVDGDRPPNLA